MELPAIREDGFRIRHPQMRALPGQGCQTTSVRPCLANSSSWNKSSAGRMAPAHYRLQSDAVDRLGRSEPHSISRLVLNVHHNSDFP